VITARAVGVGVFSLMLSAATLHADTVEAISVMYGPTAKPASKSTRAVPPPIVDESGTRVAEWRNAEHAAVLYRSSYASGLRLILTSVKLDALARAANARAVRLDELDAPQRERARQKKSDDDARALQEKARLTNKGRIRTMNSIPKGSL
jgi:hypothetical protein